ncbi:MAG: hypothetical protein Faunusvirus4_13 [Faunusvirus sp.]|jgi:hypothetical protein|uniref:Uncharacterized protein n=1 Tax=Faunusvirus sp. TaxID=2487766 RepID=A0A3G4ZW83_9VIRU|nr:MAG: hypothetical protein Faunusvirus4_13 [Faunusvirus sp.]
MYNLYWAAVKIVLFGVLASKAAFDQSNKHLSGLLGATVDAAGAPTNLGLALHGVLFVAALWALCWGAAYLGYSSY